MSIFLLIVIALALGLPPGARSLWPLVSAGEPPSFLYESTWLVAFMTAVVFVYLYRLVKPGMFVQLYLLSMAVKLIASLAYLLVMVLDDGAGARSNVVYYLVVYVLFTSLEIAFLYRKISGSSGS